MKKGMKSCLFVVIALISLCVFGVIMMAVFKICPPEGPWPMPPWCTGETDQVGGQVSDDMGCFPTSCALIPDEKGRKFCEDWKNGVNVWPENCTNVGSPACEKLCNSDNASTTLNLSTKTPDPSIITKFLPSEVDIYGRDWYKKIEDLPLTGTIYAFGPALQGGVKNNQWLKDRGARVYSVISIWNEDTWKTPDQLPPEMSTAYVTGFDNEPLYIQEVVFLNILDPNYQNWIKARMRELIDADTDGFTFDETQGTSTAVAWNMGGPGDQYSLNGFREYLQEKYSEDELKSKGVKDITAFNYCTFLDENGYRESYLKENYDSAPFKKDFYVYLYRATNEVIIDLIEFGKTYAAEKGKTIHFGANLRPLERYDSKTFYPLIDTFVFEQEWFPSWRFQGGEWVAYDYGQPVSPHMKYAVSQGKPVAAMYAINDSTKLSEAGVTGGTILIQHQFAESYANLGYYRYVDLMDYLGLYFDAKNEMMYPYFMFIRENPRAFKNLQLKTDLAVLMPPHFDITDAESMYWAQGVSNALSQANLQHDYVDVNKISNYKVVIASGKAWSKEEVKTLVDFMQQGGIVIAFDSRFASQDEGYKKVYRPELAGMMSNGAHSYGTGKFIFFSEDMGTQLWRSRSATETDKLVKAVSQFISADIAPENVQVLPYIGSQRLVVHILNYDYQEKDFVRKENLPVQIHIPDGFSTEGLSMKAVSPDFEGEQAISFEQEGNLLKFTVPTLYIWDAVILE